MTKITNVRAVDGVDNLYKFRAYFVDWTARLFPAEDALEVWVSCDVLPTLGYRAIEVPLGSIRDEDDMRDVIMRSDFESGFKNLGMKFDLEDWLRSDTEEEEGEQEPHETEVEVNPPEGFSFVSDGGFSFSSDGDGSFSFTSDGGSFSFQCDDPVAVDAEVIDEKTDEAKGETPVDVRFSFSSGSDAEDPGFHIYFQGQKLF